jgi:VanZ family protein
LNRLPARAAYLALALACLAFAAYGSLLPFDFEWTSFDIAWRHFRALILYSRPMRVSRSDLLANALLFVPVGFALAGALLAGRRTRWGLIQAIVVILPVSIASSVAIEFLQVFAPGRIPSAADIATQTIGCVAGIVLWISFGEGLTSWFRATFAAAPEDRLSRLLTAYAFGWIFVNLAPFDITVDLGDLAARVRSGKIALVPFADPNMLSPRWIWDALAECLAAIPLGVFGVAGWKAGHRHRPITAAAIALAIVVAVECAQIFIRSHAASSTDVVFALLGIFVGVGIGARLLPRDGLFVSEPGRTINRYALAFVGLWIVVLCAYHWAPYDFSADSDMIRRKLARMSLLPFAGYRSSTYLNALNNLLTKLALALPFGFGAAFAIHGVSRRMLVAGWLAAALAVFGIVEFGQLFVPGRVPDPTDILVGAAGAAIGLRLGFWLGSAGAPEGNRRGDF